MDRAVDHPPEVIAGRYELEGPIGEGGMARVFRARHLALQSHVAIKFLLRTPDAAALARFLNEARLTAQLKTRYAVQVFDYGVSEDGRPFLAMELLEGETLAARLRKVTRLSPGETARFVAQTARALERAHALGIIHRDLKPENLFIVRDEDGAEQIKVMDFGIAKLLGTLDAPRGGGEPVEKASPESVTATGTRLGTPRYMAPEQIEAAGAVTAATDVWALGVVSYVCLTGKHPFDGADVASLFECVLRAAPPPVRALDRALPEEVDDWMRRACARDPAARFETPREAARALSRALGVKLESERAEGEPDEEAIVTGEALPPEGPTTVTPTAEELTDVVVSPATPSARRARPLWVALGVIALAGSALGVTLVARDARRSTAAKAPASSAPAASTSKAPISFDVRAARRLTFGEGCEGSPTFLPDGAHIVYRAAQADGGHVLDLDTVSGQAREIAKDPGGIASAAASPDGKWVAYLALGDRKVHVIDVAASLPTRAVGPGPMRPQWSHDDPDAVWVQSSGGIALVRATDGETVRTAMQQGGLPGIQTIVDLGADTFLTLFFASQGEAGGVGIVKQDGALTWLLHDDMAEVLTLAQGGRVALVTRGSAAGLELLTLPLDGSPPSPVSTVGLTPGEGISIAPDGKHVAWSTCKSSIGMGRVDASGQVVDLTPNVSWMDGDAWRLPGTHLLMASTRDGSFGVWDVDIAGAVAPRMIPLPDDVGPDNLAVSPDSTHAAMLDNAGAVWLLTLDGSAPPRKVVKDGGSGADLSFTHDGRRLVIETKGPKSWHVALVDLATAAVATLVADASRYPAASPVDDSVVYFAARTVNTFQLMKTDLAGGPGKPLCPEELGVRTQTHPRFSPDGTHVAFVRDVHTIWEVDVKTCAHRAIDLGTAEPQEPVYTSSGELMFIRSTFFGDVWLGPVSGL